MSKQTHLKNLSSIFGLSVEETKRIYPKLKELERLGHRSAEDHCNGTIDGEQMQAIKDSIRSQFEAMVPDIVAQRNLYLNTDPRGYFLKFSDAWVRGARVEIERDWGGFGIICPEDVR